MKKLCLESNENGSSLIITGDVDSIFSNRRAARYLKDTVRFAKTDDSIVVEADDDINKSIDRIRNSVSILVLTLFSPEGFLRL